ncbi:MAG: T9SS type A sorting domain-containing protein [Bacteroidales bacterium]|nr:T9SS type A sorting domain-containing protein [Bacteroidales bacterium]MCF8403138.1 T9SS type A sorting domain-containing protein [Bacteroidales bacterium]
MKNNIYYLIAAVGMFVILTAGTNFSGGSPGGKTGSPGDGGNTCTDCHAGTATSQSGWITSTIPAEGYTPGETYTITATGVHSGVVKFGFELTAEDMSNNKTGSLIVTNPTEMQLANSNNSITHKSAGTTPSGNSKSWSFDWTAPSQGTGNVTFYGAFNAANGNGNNTGDIIYKSSLSVLENEGSATGLTISLSGMTPHVGQFFEARLIDKATQMEVERMALNEILNADFDIVFSNVTEGKSYWVDFYADHNNNEYYDGIPTDHAWRLTVNNILDGTQINFVHNTNFSEIYWKHMYELEFNGMTPHIGQKLEVRLIEQNTMMEAGRSTLNTIDTDEFSIFLPYLVSGTNYFVDFYADLNGNGIYDAPPTDHAWRIELIDVEGDEDDNFDHNTNFTDIGWNYRFTLNASSMNPHQGQLFELRLVNQQTFQEAGRLSLDSVVVADFSALAVGLEIGEDYYIDFYADHNGNGTYNAPPADHAWRLELNGVEGDSELDFSHNTNFTDIEWPLTGIFDLANEIDLNVYPNPASDWVYLKSNDQIVTFKEIILIHPNGQLVRSYSFDNSSEIVRLNMENIENGIYYLVIQLDNNKIVTRSIIKN